MFNGLQSAAWSRPRLHLGLLCPSLDKPAAIKCMICKSQLSGCAASVKDHQVWRTFVLNLRPHYVELSARHCKRHWLHRRVQVETKNLLIWIIVWLDWILQMCCKCALVSRTVRFYGLGRNINYHNNNNNINSCSQMERPKERHWTI